METWEDSILPSKATKVAFGLLSPQRHCGGPTRLLVPLDFTGQAHYSLVSFRATVFVFTTPDFFCLGRLWRWSWKPKLLTTTIAVTNILTTLCTTHYTTFLISCQVWRLLSESNRRSSGFADRRVNHFAKKP